MVKRKKKNGDFGDFPFVQELDNHPHTQLHYVSNTIVIIRLTLIINIIIVVRVEATLCGRSRVTHVSQKSLPDHTPEQIMSRVELPIPHIFLGGSGSRLTLGPQGGEPLTEF